METVSNGDPADRYSVRASVNGIGFASSRIVSLMDNTGAAKMVNFSERTTQRLVSEKRPTLTKRQQEIYDFLADKINNRGYGPTVREIGLEFKIKSPNGVMCHLKALERKGLIRRESNMSRAICLTENQHGSSSLSLLGQASAASPMRQADAGETSVDFRSMFDSNDAACIQVDGAHYMSLGIHHGDFIVVQRQETAEDNAMLATLDDRNNLVLARKDFFDGRLVPVLPSRCPSLPETVLGTVTGVIRKFEQTPVAEAVSA